MGTITTAAIDFACLAVAACGGSSVSPGATCGSGTILINGQCVVAQASGGASGAGGASGSAGMISTNMGGSPVIDPLDASGSGQGCPIASCPPDASEPPTPDASEPPTPEELMSVLSQPSNYGFTFKNSWFIFGCKQQSGHQCINAPICPLRDASIAEDSGLVSNELFPLGGRLGRTYAVTFVFDGLVEGKYYSGGSWARSDIERATPGGSPAAVNESGIVNDTFYIGGTPLPSRYATMRMRVLDPAKKELARYYMNAYATDSGGESTRTFLVSYAHTIDAPGGGFIELHSDDADCSSVGNCGPASGVSFCDVSRTIPNEPNVQLPAMYDDVASPTQPHLVPLAELNSLTGAKQPWDAQISHITVTKVVPIN